MVLRRAGAAVLVVLRVVMAAGGHAVGGGSIPELVDVEGVRGVRFEPGDGPMNVHRGVARLGKREVPEAEFPFVG